MKQLLLSVFAFAAATRAQPSVLTAQYDNQRTGANTAETILTPRNLNAAQFGRVFFIPTDGAVFAQPLYVPNLDIPGKGVHNVVFIATEHDSVYAVDATGQPAEPLWRVSFINPAAGVNPVSESAMQCPFIPNEVGVTSTPAIDAASRTLYVLARTAETGADRKVRYYQRLHALDLATGAERPGSPVLIRASVPDNSFFGLIPGELAFHALLENPRAALLLSGGNVYLAWASACDNNPYYGWVLAYDAHSLKPTGVFNTAPEGGEGGIWQSDAGIAADAESSVYAVTGNGAFNAATGGHDYGDSVLKLAFRNGALGVRDYFTPFDQQRLNAGNVDLGSGGPLLLPDQPGAHPHLLITGGKGGLMYLIDRDRMGGFHAASNSHAVETIQIGTGMFGAPAYWNGHLYFANRKDTLTDYQLANGLLPAAPAHRGNQVYDHPGAIPAISANGAKDGIVWLVYARGRDRSSQDTDAFLYAYDAADVSRELFSVVVGPSVRFGMVTVAGGRVYVGEMGGVYVYGLKTTPRLRPTTARK